MALPNQEQNPYQASGAMPHAESSTTGDGTGGLIPYKNMPALVSYYLGVFSLVPCLGFFLGVAAVILGIIGLRKRAENPIIKGAAHAWVGIILGGLFALVWGVAMFGFVAAALLS